MSDIVSWPWPRIITSEYKLFLVSGVPGGNLTLSELFYTSDGYWGTLPVLNLGAYADTNELSIADFGPFYIVCTLGQDTSYRTIRRMYVRDLTQALGYAFASFDAYSDPICGVCCNFNGQFLGGNISATDSGNWRDLNSRSILWSDIGAFELDAAEGLESGFEPTLGAWPVRQSVQVYKLMLLGNSMIAYTDAGPVRMSPALVNSTFVYTHLKEAGLGIASGNHVAGDSTVHGLIDLRGDFWILAEGTAPIRRGYREYLRTILDYASGSNTRTIVTYIPYEQTFYVSNGVECLVITKYGAYKCHQKIASAIVLPSGDLVGTCITGTDLEARVTTDVLDFESRGLKSVESLLADESHPSGTSATLSVNWRMSKSSTFVSRPWINAGPIGRSGVHTAGLEFQLRARFSNYVDVELTGLLANVKYSDQRFKRGTVPRQYEVGSA